jgi:type II secretory pathway component GspD/PulD (secretin)
MPADHPGSFIHHLDYADAEYLVSILQPLLSKEGTVVAYRPTNSLIIKERASLVKRLVEIIKGVPDHEARLQERE